MLMRCDSLVAPVKTEANLSSANLANPKQKTIKQNERDHLYKLIRNIFRH